MRFVVLSGRHRENGQDYDKGDVVESPHNLSLKFGSNKFKRLGDKAKAVAKPMAPPVDEDDFEDEEDEYEEDDEELEEEEEEEEEPAADGMEDGDPERVGKNVTASIPGVPEGYRVFQFGGGYFTVVDEDNVLQHTAAKIRKTGVDKLLRELSGK